MTFILLYWKWILAGLAALGLGAFCLYFSHLRSENARLTLELETSRIQAARLSSELAANQAALTARMAVIEGLTQEKIAAMAELEKVYNSDPKAEAWAEQELPESIYQTICKK